MDSKLSKEYVIQIISSIKDAECEIDADFVYDVYELAYESIQQLAQHNVIVMLQAINSFSLVHYIIGEYIYSIRTKTKEQQLEFNSSNKIKIQMASVVADKYMAAEILEYKPETYANRFMPPISSLDTYCNFMLNLLAKLSKKSPNETLIIDLMYKSVSTIRCILQLLCSGYETEAMAMWRTIHESECVLILLDKYGQPLIDAYNKHMTYGAAYHGLIEDEEINDQMFVMMKSEYKAKGLKSKDMKKYIEYGWLYQTEESKDESFKLNFRDGLEFCAGLKAYSKIYEQSSEIVHSTPMLIYSNSAYYYLLSLKNVYDSFFRIERIFARYSFKGEYQAITEQYNSMKNIYFKQLNVIYNNIVRDVNKYEIEDLDRPKKKQAEDE